MIVVTGAGGRLGGGVLAELLRQVPEDSVGVSTTRPDGLAEPAGRGVRVRYGSYDEPESLREAFAGADRLLLVSAPRHGAAAVDAHRVAIAAARDAGVGHVFYTSHVGADALSPFPPAVTHATTEVLLRDSGLPFTALRNGFYADTPLRLLAGAAASGELRVPADAPVSWTVHRDLAPAIAALLTAPEVPGPALNLTAGPAWDMAGLAELATTVLGRPVRHVVVGDAEFASGLRAAGVPELGVTMTLAIFQAARQRRLGIVDPGLADLIGRPTTPLAELLRASLAPAG